MVGMLFSIPVANMKAVMARPPQAGAGCALGFNDPDEGKVLGKGLAA
jgi:hypothetical protein